MNWEAWFTILIVLAVFVGLLRSVGPTDMVLWGGTVLLGLAGIITPREVLEGFSNEGMLTVAALFVIAAALRETGALDRVGSRLLGRAESELSAQLRLAPQVAGFSAILNNTAVVAMLMPLVSDWCRKRRVSPSKLLLPLSYLTILGGVCTLIGTSTNLIVHGLLLQAGPKHTDPAFAAQLRGMDFFELTWVGVPAAVVGALFLLTIGRRLLPDRKDLLEQFGEKTREYLVDMRVAPNCALIGKSIAEAGLRHLPGLFLIEIVRNERVIAPVEPDEVLVVDDRLTFTGAVSTIFDLERIPGLVPAADEGYETRIDEQRQRRYCEAVISSTSPLIGKTIRDGNFRARYNAAVVAVHRGGERISGRIGDIVLRSGDTLLLQAGRHFVEANRNNPGFFLVSGIDEARPVRHDRAWLASGLLALLVLMMVFGEDYIPVVMAAFAIAGLMVITRCISATDARRGVQIDVLLAIAASFGMGKALQNSGAAAMIAQGVTGSIGEYGPIAVLAAVYGLTMVLTELISNNAAAVLVFPLAVATAEQMGVSPRPFAMAVTYAASFGFATPIGYQTHMMVFGPGGYRFSDFLKVGIPMDLLMWAVCVALIPLVWPFQMS